MKATLANNLMDILDSNRTLIIVALAGGSLFGSIAAWDAFTSPIQWSPASNSSGGWIQSPGLDSLNNAFNHTFDVVGWLIGGVVHMGRAFSFGAVVFAGSVFVVYALTRFAHWFAANFRLA